MLQLLHGIETAQAAHIELLRRVALSLFVVLGAALLSGPCLAEEKNNAAASDAWAKLAQAATASADDSALAESRGMGGLVSAPDALAVILWDEKSTCCGRPNATSAPQPQGGTRTVSFRVVIEK